MGSRFIRRSLPALAALATLAIPHLANAAGAHGDRPWWAGELAASTGMEWSAGDYDEPGEDTEILYVPVSLSYRFDDLGLTAYPLDQWSLRITVPYLEVDSPLAFFAETPTDQRRRVIGQRRERGLGDVVASATYSWFSLDDRWPGLEFTGKIKLPTADEDRNLGTGAADGFVQLDAFQTWGQVTGFATAGVRFPGDPSDGHLRDSVYASGGFSAKWVSRISSGVYYSWFDSASSSRHDAHEIVGFASLRWNDALSVEPYAVWGVAGYAPDYAVGISLRIRNALGRD